MPSIICTRCGFANEGAVRFCGHCGAPLPVTPTVSAPPPSPVVEPTKATVEAGIACPRCGILNQAGARFCGHCGSDLSVAPVAASGGVPVAFPRATPGSVLETTPRKVGRGLPWAAVVAVLGIAMVGLAGISQVVMSHGASPCGVRCLPPPPPLPPLGPSGPPLPPVHRYTSSTYGFSVDYPDGLSPSSADAQTVNWSYNLNSDNSSFIIQIQGEAANGRTPLQIVQSVQQKDLAGAAPVFTITGAELGSTLGYGQIYDLTTSPQGGQQQHLHVVIEAAIRNGVAVEVIGESLFLPDRNDHPSPAQMEPAVERWVDMFGNTVVWQGEPAL